MRQIIRGKLPDGSADPNNWMRLETLRFIGGAHKPTMQEIAGFLRVKAPSATSLIGYLVRHGFVERFGEERDKRVTRLRLTPKGKKALAAHMRASEVLMRRVFAEFSQRDVEELARILRHLRDTHTLE